MRMPPQTSGAIKSGVGIFRHRGGILRTREALRLGIHPRTLYAMKKDGWIKEISRGLYRLAELPDMQNPDLVAVSLKIPRGVICLLSALAYHELTTQIPHKVDIAVPPGSERPRIDYPPIRISWFTGRAFEEGIEVHKVDGIPVRIYGPEKTIADCFKYRNKLGLDTPLEALKLYRRRRNRSVPTLLRFASVCRVEKVMRPYLEAIL